MIKKKPCGYLLKSGEDYLEAIYNLSQEKTQIRSVDIANILKVTKPSTFTALQNLAEQGCIIKENYGTVTLTDKGRQLAQAVLKKHKAIRMLLKDVLHVSPENAENDACKIEHVISEETTQRLFEFLKITAGTFCLCATKESATMKNNVTGQTRT